MEFCDATKAGYITLSKKIRKDKRIRWQFIVDDIPVEFTKKVFDDFANVLHDIKEEQFQPNFYSCFAWNRKCEYWDLCKNGEMGDLFVWDRDKK